MLHLPFHRLVPALGVLALIVSTPIPTWPSPVHSFQAHHPLASSKTNPRLDGTWLGFEADRAEPDMKVTFSSSGWLTMVYFGTPPGRLRCRYRLSSNDVVITKCADRGMQVHWLDGDTIEFKVTDRNLVEELDIMYVRMFRRERHAAQPN
jgi:hypothetical protein